MVRVEKDGSITVGILPAVEAPKPRPVAPAEEKPVKKTRKTVKK